MKENIIVKVERTSRVMERWPNFFIVGAPKAGTTSLYEYLKDIPGIYMSPVKEPKFFSSNFSSQKKNLGSS